MDISPAELKLVLDGGSTPMPDFEMSDYVPYKFLGRDEIRRIRNIKREDITRPEPWHPTQFRMHVVSGGEVVEQLVIDDIVRKAEYAHHHPRERVVVVPPSPWNSMLIASATEINRRRLIIPNFHLFFMVFICLK